MPSDRDRSPGDPEAIRRLLSQPESRTVLAALEARDPAQVRAAAQAALQGDAGELERLLRALSRDAGTRRAIEKLDRATQ